MRHRAGRVSPALIPIAIIVFVVTFAAVVRTAADVLSELGIQEKRAHSSILDAIWYGQVNYRLPGGQDVFKAAPPEKRAAFVRAAAAFAKAYVNSDTFRQGYADSREGAKPKPPEAEGSSTSDEAKERKQAIEQARANLKTAKTAQERDMYAQIVKSLEDMDKMMSSQEMQAMMASAGKAQRETEAKEYQADLKKWETDYPKDPNLLVARRLKEFLAMSATVDFQAQTVKKGRVLKFVNPAYEEKPEDWKICFRAGKEAVDAARAVATEWLKELSQKT